MLLMVPHVQVGVYCLLSLVTIFFGEAFPLLLVAPVSSGGLGWSASQAIRALIDWLIY